MGDVILILNKSFSLLFIFSITAVNFWLVGNFLYWKNVFTKDKKIIISSLAICDILIGLFCQTVEASLHFDIYLGGPGCVLSYVQIYSQFFAPFVCGISISLLVVELILKERGKSFYKWNKLFSLLIFIIPWLLAIIVTLPLVFIGRSTKSCWYLPKNVQGICMWAVSTFVPVIISLGLWSIAAFIKRKELSDTTTSTCKGSSVDFTETGPASQALLPVGERTDCSQTEKPSYMETPMDVSNSSNLEPSAFIHATETVSSPSSFQADGSQQLSAHVSSHTNRSVNQLPGDGCSEVKKGHEKIHLLLIIFIYVLLTVPFSMYNLMKLASDLYGSGSLMSQSTSFVLKLMQISRSVFVPLTWSVIFYFEKRKIYY